MELWSSSFEKYLSIDPPVDLTQVLHSLPSALYHHVVLDGFFVFFDGWPEEFYPGNKFALLDGQRQGDHTP